MAESTKAPNGNGDGKLTLHHLNHSQSQRILWLLCELFPNETPPRSYDLVLYSRQTTGKEQSRAPSSLRKTHPLGKSPQLITPTGRTIIESSAIAKYLIETYDKNNNLKGDGDASKGHDSIRDEMFCSFANASIMPVVTLRMFLDVLTSQTPWLLRPLPKAIRYGAVSAFVKPEMEKMFAYLDSELEGREFFLGSRLSRADIMMSWPLDFCVQRGYLDLDGEDGKKFPRVKAWRERVLGREAWKEAIRKLGGAAEYDLRTFG